MWNAAACRIDVDTETVLEGTISEDDIPRSLIGRANGSQQAVDCTWVIHGPPLYRVSRVTQLLSTVNPRDAVLARCQLSPGVCVYLSVCHKSELYQNSKTERAGVWHRGFVPPIQYSISGKLG